MEREAIEEGAAAARRGGARGRLGKRHRQLDRLGLGKLVGLVTEGDFLRCAIRMFSMHDEETADTMLP